MSKTNKKTDTELWYSDAIVGNIEKAMHEAGFTERHVEYDPEKHKFTCIDKKDNSVWESFDGIHWGRQCDRVYPPLTGSNVKPSDTVWNALDMLHMERKLSSVRDHNVGESDYCKHKIQPWDIWIEYKLNPFDADIIKRVLRHKKTDSRKMDYEKIIHICQERIRQIDNNEDVWEEKENDNQ